MSTHFCRLGAAFVLLFVASEAQAGRVVSFDVLLDGKVVLEGRKLDQGEDADTAWGYLSFLRFEQPNPDYIPEKERPAKGFAIVPDKDDPLKATLKGKIRVFCRYAGDVELDSLKLVRAKKDGKEWQLAPEEVERTKKLRKVDPKSKVRE